jgi:hypothetical protein
MAARPTKLVRLTDEVDSESWISDRTFTDSLILGPAVCAPTGSLEIIECAFAGPPESMLIEIPPDQQIQGIVGFRNLRFERCLFQDVAFIGTPDGLAGLRQAMLRAAANQDLPVATVPREPAAT